MDAVPFSFADLSETRALRYPKLLFCLLASFAIPATLSGQTHPRKTVPMTGDTHTETTHVTVVDSDFVIVPDAGVRGVKGDLVPSNNGDAGERHFVSPKKANDFVELKAVATIGGNGNFNDYSWNPAPQAGTDVQANGAADKIKVKRDAAKKITVKLQSGNPAVDKDKLHIWIVWSTIAANAANDLVLDHGALLQIRMGYIKFTHTISPNLIVAAQEYPNLEGEGGAVPPLGGLTYNGFDMAKGAPKKWDNSRAVRQKFINPSCISLRLIPGDAGYNTTFPNFPSAADGDGRPGGVGEIDASIVPVAGNDDAGEMFQGDNNPYEDPDKGSLTCADLPSRGMVHAVGDNGDTVEWRLQFIEFIRLNIGGTWYRISDDFPWRCHIKMKKVAGKWTNNGSSKALNNDGF